MKWYRNNQTKAYFLLIPLLFFVLLLAGFGLVQTFLESLKSVGSSEEWTLQHYRELYTGSIFWNSLAFSFWVTLISTVISLVIGVIMAKFLYQFFINEKWRLLMWLPMLIPHFVAGYLMLFFFAQSGWFSSLFYQIGFIADRNEFPIMVLDRYGIGIILAYVWKEVPFVVLMLLPVYHQLDERYGEVVRTLGGGKWEVFKTAEWPWLAPVVTETGIIIFAFIFAAFEIPHILGVTYPQMMPVVAYEWFQVGDWSMRPKAMAMMITTTFFILTLAFISFRLSQNIRYKIMRGGSE